MQCMHWIFNKNHALCHLQKNAERRNHANANSPISKFRRGSKMGLWFLNKKTHSVFVVFVTFLPIFRGKVRWIFVEFIWINYHWNSSPNGFVYRSKKFFRTETILGRSLKLEKMNRFYFRPNAITFKFWITIRASSSIC